MSQSLLGAGTKRLTSRRRTKRRGPQRREVVPAVTKQNLSTPIYGCQPDVFQGTILEVPTEDIDIKVTRQEKDIVMAKARKQAKALPNLIIQSISYTIFAHEDLERQALFEVTKTDELGINTVNDPRSGIVDDDKLCVTCGADNLQCPGHYGIIKLNQHIIHPQFRRVVVDILTAVCNSCGGLLLDPDTIEEKGYMKMTGSTRLRAIADASKRLHCRRFQENIEAGVRGCINNPTYKTARINETGKLFYSFDGKKGKENERTVEEIEDILSAISEADAAILGFSGESHPSRFVLKSIPVIPICARAPVIQDGMLLKDHITSMYLDVVRINQDLAKINEVPEKDREKRKAELVKNLTFSISHLIDNSDGKYKQGKSKPYLGIKSRVQGKEAIIRNLIQGKRVNFSARTVLSPDPNLKFGQIRLPKIWAPYLTQPKTVSPSNIGVLSQLFKAGRVTHVTPAGGKFEGRRLKVTDRIRKEHNLAFGDVVERWLQDGDYVVFNRQPTLHKQGMMGYEVVLGDALTTGLHLSYTPPHNAD
jgi:DNA-directed RNA polymerase beta' subunit